MLQYIIRMSLANPTGSAMDARPTFSVHFFFQFHAVLGGGGECRKIGWRPSLGLATPPVLKILDPPLIHSTESNEITHIQSNASAISVLFSKFNIYHWPIQVNFSLHLYLFNFVLRERRFVQKARWCCHHPLIVKICAHKLFVTI